MLAMVDILPTSKWLTWHPPWFTSKMSRQSIVCSEVRRGFWKVTGSLHWWVWCPSDEFLCDYGVGTGWMDGLLQAWLMRAPFSCLFLLAAMGWVVFFCHDFPPCFFCFRLPLLNHEWNQVAGVRDFVLVTGKLIEYTTSGRPTGPVVNTLYLIVKAPLLEKHTGEMNRVYFKKEEVRLGTVQRHSLKALYPGLRTSGEW